MRIPSFLASIALAAASPCVALASQAPDEGPMGMDHRGRPSSARILVLDRPESPETAPGQPLLRIAATLDYRHSVAEEHSYPGAGAGVEFSIPAGPLRLAAFLSAGALAVTETWIEDRPFVSTASGEPVTYVRRVEVTETRAESRVAAGAGLGFDMPLGGPWRIGICAGPCAAGAGDSWGPGARASATILFQSGGAALLFRVAGEVARAREFEGGFTAGIGASISF